MTKSNTLSPSLSREAVVDHRMKLTAAQVAEIRRRYARQGVLQRELAREFGVAQTTISQIIALKIHRASPRRPPTRASATPPRGRNASRGGRT